MLKLILLNKRYTKRYAILIVLVILCFNLFSQIDTSFVIPEILIAQDRNNLTIKEHNRVFQIVTHTDISTSGYTTLPEILQNLGGIDVRRRGPHDVQSDITIRGGSFEQVLIVLNGIIMNDPQTGHHSFYLPIHPSQIERIEILKGGASRMYGQNAYSGVIHVITKTKKKNKLSIYGDLGSFQTTNLGLTGSWDNERLTHHAGIDFTLSDGYRHNTDFQIFRTNYTNHFKIGKNKFDFLSAFTERKFGANGFYANESFTEQYEEVQTSIIGLTATIPINSSTIIKPKISWRRNQDMYLFDRQKPELFRNMHINNSLRAEIHGMTINKLGHFGWGIDANHQNIRSNNLGMRERQLIGLFIDQSFIFFDEKVSLNTGTYAQYISDRNKFFFYPSIDLGYNLSQNTKIILSTGLHNRVPSWTELHYNSRTELSNPNLLAERAWETEIGIKHHDDIIRWSAILFRRQSFNTIDWGKDSLAQSLWIIDNISEIFTTGLELNFQIKWSKRLKSNITYTYLNNQLLSSSEKLSRYALDNLRHQFNAQQYLYIIPEKLKWGVNVRFNNRNVPESLTNINGLEPFWVFDSQIQYIAQKSQWGISFFNVTNQIYREISLVPMPGRWLSFSYIYDVL